MTILLREWHHFLAFWKKHLNRVVADNWHHHHQAPKRCLTREGTQLKQQEIKTEHLTMVLHFLRAVYLNFSYIPIFPLYNPICLGNLDIFHSSWFLWLRSTLQICCCKSLLLTDTAHRTVSGSLPLISLSASLSYQYFFLNSGRAGV